MNTTVLIKVSDTNSALTGEQLGRPSRTKATDALLRRQWEQLLTTAQDSPSSSRLRSPTAAAHTQYLRSYFSHNSHFFSNYTMQYLI